MNDLMHRISQARPTEDELAQAWPKGQQDLLLARLRDQAQQPARVRRRTAWLAVAAVFSAVAVVPPIVGGGDASARSEILALAAVAAEAESPLITPGKYLHVTTESIQENAWFNDGGATYDTNRESWIAWDGAEWAVDTRPSAGWTEIHRFPAGGEEPSFGSPTPEFLAGLPDAPDELRAYLDATVKGSNSHDEALFTAVTDMASSRLLTPQTLSVALEAIADIGRVRTQDVSVEGRDAVEISFRPYRVGIIATESFTIDRTNAQVLRVASSDPGGSYRSTTTLLEIVDAVPDAVTSAHARYGAGVRICADGAAADENGHC